MCSRGPSDLPAGPSGRRGARHGCNRTRGRPSRSGRGGRLSRSVAKAPIAPGRARRIVDIPRFFSRPIAPRSAFATDSDKFPPRHAPGAPPAPVFHRFDDGAGVGGAGAVMVGASAPRPGDPAGTSYLSERVPQWRWFSMLHAHPAPSPRVPPPGGPPGRAGALRRRAARLMAAAVATAALLAACSTPHAPRSEEHTSELQSR